jgi:hypothetical protein
MPAAWNRLVLLGIAAFAWSTPNEAYAKNAIAGQVVDRNGKPVERVIVTLEPGNIQLVTDAEGRFLIDYVRDDAGERRKLTRKVDYVLEAFKTGFHVEGREFFYKRGLVEMETITLREDTLQILDDGADLDPTLLGDPTQATGATYEGQ